MTHLMTKFAGINNQPARLTYIHPSHLHAVLAADAALRARLSAAAMLRSCDAHSKRQKRRLGAQIEAKQLA